MARRSFTLKPPYLLALCLAAGSAPAADSVTVQSVVLSDSASDPAPTEKRMQQLLARHAPKGLTLFALPAVSQTGSAASATSSSHSRWRDRVYRPRNVLDGNYRTAWVEGHRSHGLGEWISLAIDFDEEDGIRRLCGLLIVSGFAKNRFMFIRNSRPRAMALALQCAPSGAASGHSQPLRQRLRVQDTRQPQLFLLSESRLVPAAGRCIVRLTLEEFYPGSHYADTSIAEIRMVLSAPAPAAGQQPRRDSEQSPGGPQ